MSPSKSDADSLPVFPELEKTAFFLDFDGTLVDIVPTPDEVVVQDGLRNILLALRKKCNNALAVVTGRPIQQIDHFLPNIPFAVAGEHGSAFRYTPREEVTHLSLPPLPPIWLEEARHIARQHPGVLVEPKSNGFVLHFRQVPHLEDELKKIAQTWVAQNPDKFEVHSAKMAWEVRPKGVDKGRAVRELMKHAPFKGRLPVFIGDDITDEDGIQAAKAMGGAGYRIPVHFPEAQSVRDWLKRLIERTGS